MVTSVKAAAAVLAKLKPDDLKSEDRAVLMAALKRLVGNKDASCDCDCPQCLAGDCAACSDAECADPNCETFPFARIAATGVALVFGLSGAALFSGFPGTTARLCPGRNSRGKRPAPSLQFNLLRGGDVLA